eukprot:m.81799 g.81799  ORF g.81799 m.81799 type:complete len:69 (+) comp25450_c1_seq2:442-648(+)
MGYWQPRDVNEKELHELKFWRVVSCGDNVKAEEVLFRQTPLMTILTTLAKTHISILPHQSQGQVSHDR